MESVRWVDLGMERGRALGQRVGLEVGLEQPWGH